jgi:pimeloyl-ACP methyl ester carboxylesterase
MIYGDQDQIIPGEAAVQTGSSFVYGVIAEIRGAGHLLNMEQAGEFNRILGEWLDHF